MAMDRRSFIARLAAAAAGVATIGLIDPERLLWTPGEKTIIDLGAGRQVVPATDAEVVRLASPFDLRSAQLTASDKLQASKLQRQFADGRDIRLDIFDPDRQSLRSFSYVDDQLVGHYVKADLELLQQPFVGRKGVR